MTRLKFEELSLSEEIKNAVRDMGFEEASPIQSEAIPLISQGKDIIGQAQTGTGKTAAFAIPVIEKLNPESKEIQALVLCPTRELVIQVAEEFRKIMKYKQNLYIAPVYGGQEIERQLRTLKKGVQIVIGTPGRLMDHIRRGSVKMESVNTVVLDEADEMLDMGFRDDIEIILRDTPESRQTIMFSATMAKEIIGLTKQYQKDPVIINVTNKKLDAPRIHQVYFEVQEKNKPEVLSRLLDLHNIKLALVFCNTKSQVDQLVDILKSRGYFADALHGDMSQNHRDRVTNGFRNGSVEILVATDVAGRGIDVNNVEAVFNYDLPRDDEDYIHRIGRTARAGKSGTAFTFIVGKQIYNLTRIQHANGFPIIRQTTPTIDEIETTRINSYTPKISEIIEARHLSKYINQVEALMKEEYTSLDVAAALLKMIMEKENESFDHTVNFEIPAEERKSHGKKTFRNKTEKNYGRKDGFHGRSNDKKRTYKKDESEKQEYKSFKPAKTITKSFSEESQSFKPYDPTGKNESNKPFRKFDKDRKRKFSNEDKPYQKSQEDKPYKRSAEDKPFKKTSEDKPHKRTTEDKPYKAKRSDSSFRSDKPSKGGYQKQNNENKKFGDKKFRKKK